MTATVEVRTGANPYIGPRSFIRGEELFGRDQESRALLNLVIAERIVLLYSPSGAGKTSLIQAALVPTLQRPEEQFNVLPVMRVSLLPPDPDALGATTPNRFILSLLLSLEAPLPEEQQLPLDQLAAMGLDKYLRDRHVITNDTEDTEGAMEEVLIFDQFEEILTVDPVDEKAQRQFFVEVGKALQDTSRRALFSMREEYVAALDPFRHLIPTWLNTTYRLDLLRQDAAREAIQRPARQAGVEFTNDAASKLVDDLRQVHVQRPDGTSGKQLGPYIEPVQLQVVCHGLWKKLPPNATQIVVPNIGGTGDVDTELADYYAEGVAAAAGRSGVPERHIRDWFENELITRQGIKDQVSQGPGANQKLENEAIAKAIQALKDSYLIRVEKRLGATWFELAHDRLIEPVKKNNEAWRIENFSLLQRQAQRWENQEHPEGLLMQGADLAEAERWAAAHQGELSHVDREFLATSQVAERTKQRNRMWVGLAAASLAVAFVVTTISAAQANKEKAKAEALGKITLSRQLSLQAPTLLGRPDLALLLILEANRVLETVTSTYPSALTSVLSALPEARSPLLDAFQLHPYLSSFLSGHKDAVISLAFSPDGKTLASAGDDRTVILWDVAPGASPKQRGQPLTGHKASIRTLAFSPDSNTLASGSAETQTNLILWDLSASPPTSHTLSSPASNEGVYGLAFSPDGKILASGNADNTIILWNVTNPASPKQLGPPLKGHTNSVISVAFSPDGKTLASSSADNTIILWDVASRKPLGPPLTGHTNTVYSVAFSPDGKTLASGGADNTIILWDVADPAAPKRIGSPLFGHTNIVTSVAFSPDGKTLASGSYDKTVILWDVTGAKRIGPYLTGHGNTVRSVAFSPDGKTLASGSDDRTVILWDLAASDQLNEPLLGHTGRVSSVAFSPDRNHMILASGCDDGTTILWAITGTITATTQTSQTLKGHTDEVTSLAFSSDGNRLASGSADNTIILWDVASGANPASPKQHGATLFAHYGGVTSLAFSPDGNTLASGNVNNTIILWTITTTLSTTPTTPTSQVLTGTSGSVTSVAFSPDGKTLASGSDDGRIVLWTITDTTPTSQTLSGHTGSVTSVAFSPDGKTLASGSADKTIRLWDVASHKQQGIPREGHYGPVNSVAFSPDGRTLASASDDHAIYLWDLTWPWTKDKPPIAAFRGLYYRDEPMRRVAFSPDGKTLASVSADKTIILWGRGALNANQLAQPLIGHSDGVYSVAYSPDGKTLASGSYDKSVILWDVANPANRKQIGPTLTVHTNTVYSVAFSPDGKILASGSADKTIILWDVASRKPLGPRLAGHTDRVFSVAFSPDGKTLASGSLDKTIILWDVATGNQLAQPLKGHREGVLSVSFSPDGKTLASGSLDDSIILWDVANPAAPKQIGPPLTGHTDSVNSVAFSPDGKTLASGSGDNNIILWDVADIATGAGAAPKQIGSPLSGSGGGVTSLAFSPDGKTLASGTSNQTVILWDVTIRKSLNPLGEGRDNKLIGATGQSGSVNSVAFSPDGKTVASGSDDYTIYLWDVDPETWKERACSMANRNMTRAEWNDYIYLSTGMDYAKTCPNLP